MTIRNHYMLLFDWYSSHKVYMMFCFRMSDFAHDHVLIHFLTWKQI